MSTNVFQTALNHASRIAVRDPFKKVNFTYSDLLHHANGIAQRIHSYDTKTKCSTSEYPPRINLLVPPSFEHIASTYAIWSNHCISVPLCTSHPVHEMDYYVKDSQSSLIIAHSSFTSQAQQLSMSNDNLPYLIIDDLSPNQCTTPIDTSTENFAERVISTLSNDNPSVFIYTSGTTSKPKGVVHTHNTLWSSIDMLSDAWHWHKDDSILNVLPMHHIHGLVNITFCALSNGASVTFDTPNPLKIWNNFRTLSDLNVFMAVPTIYAKLIETFHQMNASEQAECQRACDRFRLMVSGSAALPNTLMKQWYEISGQWLLERYGMTEILMCLSNKYDIDKANHVYRKPGTVGFPLRNVETKINEEDGELFIKTDTMFKEYYNKPDKTKDEFTDDGWFKTGDCVSIDEEGFYRIEGRKSVDIIKYGGYKISALDIEREFLENERIKEIVVLGVPDPIYGHKIAAIVVLKHDEKDADTVHFKDWAKNQMASYKIPELWMIMDDIPKNAMGKVNKKELISLFQKDPITHT
eukprot:163990_1